MLSRDLLPCGVRGGDCTADAGGEGLGDSAPEPARRCLLGVFDPEGTYEIKSQQSRLQL